MLLLGAGWQFRHLHRRHDEGSLADVDYLAGLRDGILHVLFVSN